MLLQVLICISFYCWAQTQLTAEALHSSCHTHGRTEPVTNQSEFFWLKSEHLWVRSPKALEQEELRSQPQHRPRGWGFAQGLGLALAAGRAFGSL